MLKKIFKKMDSNKDSSKEEQQESRDQLDAGLDGNAELNLEGLEAEEPSIDLAAMEEELKQSQDKYLRTAAEMENIKKRFAKERADILRYAGESLARDLLDVVDDLERACNAFDQANATQNASSDELLKGVKLVKDRFVDVLSRHGVVANDALGEIFDPRHHEALTSVPTEDKASGTILEQFRKAYFFKDKLLRPAQVVVAVNEKKE
jgi:molecular chaperone GrpE